MQFILNNKAIIAAVIIEVSAYLLAKGVIGQEESILIGALVATIFGVKPAVQFGARLLKK